MHPPVRAVLITFMITLSAFIGDAACGISSATADTTGPATAATPATISRPRPEPPPEPRDDPRPEPWPEPAPAPRPEPWPEPAPAPRPEPWPEPASTLFVPGIIDDGPSDQVEPAAKRRALGRTMSRTPYAYRQMPGGFAGVTRSVNVTVQRQFTRYYCGPASGRVAVSALTPANTLPSQRTFAHRMGTTPSGTALSRIAPTLNEFQSRNGYVYVAGLDLDGYQSRVRSGIDTFGAPQIAPVQMSRLPWYSGTGISGGHAITSYGYSLAPKSWSMHVYDPWDGVRHTSVRSSAMFAASLNRDLIW